MRRQNSEEFRSRYVPRLHAIGLMLGGILVVASSGHAGVLTASWTAPTTKTDGSALTQLARYRVYYSTSDSPCPGSTFFEVASSTSVPPPNQTVSVQLSGLTTASIYSASVTAVDTSENESACSEVASAIARDDSATTPVQDATTPTTPMHDATTPSTSVHDATTPSAPAESVASIVESFDQFDRPDSSDLGPQWDQQRGAGIGSRQIVNQHVRASALGTGIEERHSAVVAPDQFARIVIASFGGAGLGDIGAYVRAGAPGDRTFYACSAEKQSTTTSRIYRRLGGAYMDLATENSTVWQAGDVLECRVVGSTVYLLRNGVMLLTATDTMLTNGSVGMRLREDLVFADTEIATFVWGSLN
jgi:hypothetical protein